MPQSLPSIDADRDLLEQARINLVDNAVKFSPSGTPIRVEVEGGSLTVHDQGPGIPPGEREGVFDRFHRLESARTLPGSGLGLAIVAAGCPGDDGSNPFDTAEPGGPLRYAVFAEATQDYLPPQP